MFCVAVAVAVDADVTLSAHCHGLYKLAPGHDKALV